MGVIDFNKVINYSKRACKKESMGKCATYVKQAFTYGGCKYIAGNGWSNQKWCRENDFVCIGEISNAELRNRGYNVRAHGNFNMWLPENYVQQTGDVCLIKHGEYGHICYAMSGSINDWVSDFFQRPPTTQAGSGPYCYQGNYEGVQFWRHKSVLNGMPAIEMLPISEYEVTSDEYQSDTTLTRLASITPYGIDTNGDGEFDISGILLGSNMRQL